MTCEQLDQRLAGLMQAHGLSLLRFGLGLVFVWFGAPKLVPGLSPAEGLVCAALPFCDPDWCVPLLGLGEILIGLCLLYRPWIRFGLFLMAGHMLGATLPLITLPDIAWKAFPVATLEGQYILKNMVLIAAGIVLGGACARKRRIGGRRGHRLRPGAVPARASSAAGERRAPAARNGERRFQSVRSRPGSGNTRYSA